VRSYLVPYSDVVRHPHLEHLIGPDLYDPIWGNQSSPYQEDRALYQRIMIREDHVNIASIVLASPEGFWTPGV
jgi:hypothetical protein